MKLAEALALTQASPEPGDRPFAVFLAAGSEALHLGTFLAAHLRLALPGRRAELQSGRFGDLAGNLALGLASGPDALALVVEWPDLEPRLGVRNLGGWAPSLLPDLVREVARRAAHLLALIAGAPGGAPIAVALPTLPMLPAFTHPGALAGAEELAMRRTLAEFASGLARHPRVRVVSSQRLDLLSPHAGRHDLRSELATGFPYALPHASALASLLAEALRGPAPKKGLVTDLDDTLWRGLLGEDGPEGISWDLDHGSQMHGLYQQVLASLAEAGILLGVASRNDPERVEQALRSERLLLPAAKLWPVRAHWGTKIASLAAILEAWNLGPEDLVFVDDSPMEVEQVAAAFPAMTCLAFPTRDERAVLALLWRLRDLFGKEAVREEDLLRAGSLKAGAAWSAAAAGAREEDLLREARPEVSLAFAAGARDPRAFELINKTNQFNLNGRRYTESEWEAALARPGAFLMTVTYADRFGPQGKIAAVLGEAAGGEVRIDAFVLSCRVFGRRIEHACLEALFAEFAAPRLRLAYGATERNRPLQAFLASYLGTLDADPLELDRSLFQARCPPLFHRVKEVVHA